jgi:hypothetical protein
MNDKEDQQKFLDFTRRKLDAGTDDLDADTREKLIQMRHRALESSLEGESSFPNWATLPIIAFVTAVIFIILIYVKPGPQTDNSPEDLEILLSNDPIEFYENLEVLQKWKDQKNANEKKNP